MISVGGGVKIPVMENDRIFIIHDEIKTVYSLNPRREDGKTPDFTRMKKGKNGNRFLHKHIFIRLLDGGYLQPAGKKEYVVVGKAERRDQVEMKEERPVATPEIHKITEKRLPLVKCPVRGLPPPWH
jgi:hypothetical protein